MAQRIERRSDSPFVERITLVTYDAPTREWSTPDGCWDIVVLRRAAQTTVLHTGLISRPVLLENGAGDSYLAISFKPGVFATRAPGIQMVDRGVVCPLVSARTFAMDGERLEVPTFENAEGLVARLASRGMLTRDDLVEGAARGSPRAISRRSMQRHFLLAIGMTPKQFDQIKRACSAVELLRQGMAPAAVAVEAGYSDQSHLTRSLKVIMGQTPAAFQRKKR
jgi:hypothetical protein